MSNKCLICHSNIEPFISFGQMPIANGFLTLDQFRDEYFYELKVGFCPNCSMVQLLEQPDREMMFHENYAFYSSTSKRMEAHFAEFSNSIKNEYLNASDPFVVEIGSNDGIMLQNFSKEKIRHLGVEPSLNVAQVANQKGIQTISKFFDYELAEEIVKEYGKADAILAANVMCHIPYLHSVVSGIKILLKSDGVFVFEDPYLGDIVEKVSYDQIYDEHAFYFSVKSIQNLFERYGLEVIDIMPQDVHGGSMRYVIAHKGKKEISEKVKNQVLWEKQFRLQDPETFKKLRENIERSRDSLIHLLKKIKEKGMRVVGYGATSKSTTVTNYCRLGPDLIEFISDTTPIKQGKFSPGAHIPVRRYEKFRTNYPNYSLLFAWNHAEEILAKEKDFQKNGGRWILYVPEVKIF